MKKKMAVRIVVCICAAFGWWGMLYPELTLMPDTYVMVDKDGAVHRDRNVVEWGFDSGIYRELLETDSSKIRFKSKLKEQADALLEQLQQYIE